MKPSIVQRLKARLAVARHKKKQGVAILTVLAIITLMTVLVVSFFNMATSAKVTAKGSVEIQRVTTLKDTIINLVIAQFREASNLSPTNASNPRDILTWISQPGAIRTFSGTDVSRNRLYKLYSSNVPQIGDIRPYETAKLLADINEDNVADWAERPDEFTDINRPVYTASSSDRARSAQGGLDLEGFTYPIVDPRAYNGRTGSQDLLKNTEGFSYSDKSGNKVILGIDAAKQQLAMPVRWIYMLQDGTLGYLDESKSFKTLNGAGGGKVSRENPIVGRLAWWADDESCKVNVNTASIPAAWDTPRTTSKEDQWLAQSQPISGEFQRYPGHPATVDLSAVFYPNRRWVPDPLAAILTGSQEAAGGKMSRLPLNDAARIWDLAPFISSDAQQVSGGTVGTASGQLPTPPASISTVAPSNDDRLFTSLDEMYFKASGAINKSLNSPRSNLLSEGKDPGQEFLTTLERSQFFLTHKSHSPELTNQGFPRVSMFPMDLLAVPAVGGTGSLPSGVSPYDVTMALNSTIGRKAYFFQRRDPGSRHGELYASGDSRSRNTLVFKYLKELSKLPIPGYPDIVPFQVPAVTTEDPLGLSFAAKYPPGLSGNGSTVFASAYGPSSLFDSSERTQILLNMLDYTRSINMQPAFLGLADKYDDGYGKAAGICGCANVSGANTNTTHHSCLLFSNQTTRTPKGTGKLFGAAEIAVVVNVAASRAGGAASDPVTGPWGGLYGLMSTESRARADNPGPGTRFIVEVGFIQSAFSPKQGWSASFPPGGLAVSSITPGPGDTVPTGASTPQSSTIPIIGPDQERLSTLDSVQIGGKGSGGGTERQFAKGPQVNQGIIPLGGMVGPRGSFTSVAVPANTVVNNRLARLRPYCVVVNGGNPGAVDVNLTADPTVPIRVHVMDGTEVYDVTQATDLLLPANFFVGVQPQLTNESLASLVYKWAMATPPAGAPFPDPRLFIRSFVVPHGDYRLTATPTRVDADVYVPHANYAAPGNAGRFAHSFFEGNSNPTNRSMSGSTYNPVIGLIDTLKVQKFPMPSANPFPDATKLSALPLPTPFAGRMGANSLTSMGALKFPPQDQKILEQSSMNPARRETFAHARRDGRGVVANRGSSDPFETGDFDTGVATTPDGPYMNYPDEGDRRTNGSDAYYKKLFINAPKTSAQGVGGQNISPNFLVRSPVDFGSIPTGVMNRVPWQTLRFRPDIGMNDPTKRMNNLSSTPPPGMPFANFCGPRDHFFLDMFWMPVVEPWSISEPFSTKGTINLNQQIFPFMYIERTTALHALLRGERMYAIPNSAADKYKNVNPTTGEPTGGEDASYRRFINAKETLRQFTRRYQQGADFDPIPAQGNPLAFNCFRSASEICETWLVPEELTSTSLDATLEKVVGTVTGGGQRSGFWTDHALTGDNLRERPYANLYPRVTVRSNVFKLHLVAQTLQKATSEDPNSFDSVKDSVTAEWRGSCMIERSIDPRDPLLANKDYTSLDSKVINPTTTPKLDRFYTYRVTEVKQLTQ
ncbi:MAG: Verru_Chthon cassette protein A [Verrucomicrobiota bacterium]